MYVEAIDQHSSLGNNCSPSHNPTHLIICKVQYITFDLQLINVKFTLILRWTSMFCIQICLYYPILRVFLMFFLKAINKKNLAEISKVLNMTILKTPYLLQGGVTPFDRA